MRLTKISHWPLKVFWFGALLLLALPGRSLWAQVDITGEWSPRIYNDGRDVGDFTGIPLNEAGRVKGRGWAPGQFYLPGNICRPHAFSICLRASPPPPSTSTNPANA